MHERKGGNRIRRMRAEERNKKNKMNESRGKE